MYYSEHKSNCLICAILKRQCLIIYKKKQHNIVTIWKYGRNHTMIKALLFTAGLLMSSERIYTRPSFRFVHFDLSKYELTATADTTLDSLTDTLDLADHIELHGHTDSAVQMSITSAFCTKSKDRWKLFTQYWLGEERHHNGAGTWRSKTIKW